MPSRISADHGAKLRAQTAARIGGAVEAGLVSDHETGQPNRASLCSAALRCGWRTKNLSFRGKTLSYRRVPSDPGAGEIVIDHHSGIGHVPKQDPEIVFPRTALAKWLSNGIIGALAPFHFSFMGGMRRHAEIENELAPAIAQN